jgi:Ser/Thr protein kinase RdoA (MazF antagonist)
MTESFERRIDYDGDIDQVVGRVVEGYGLGSLEKFSLIEAGFQDYNIHASTTTDEYLLKIFAQNRDEATAQRYVDIMEAALGAGVHHPQLLHDAKGQGLHKDEESGLMMAVLEFVPGKTFKELNRAPSDDELAKIAEQAVKVNSIELEPSYLFDSWAIPNIHWMFDQVHEHLDEPGTKLAQEAMRRYDTILVDKLPTAFVHGDIIQTNTILGNDSKIYLIDFACANIYPRIQELAVMAANLLHDGKISLQERIDKVRDAYLQAGGKKLTEEEEAHLYNYAVAGAAMEFLGGYYERFISKDESDEVEHWIRVGREGLEEALNP